MSKDCGRCGAPLPAGVGRCGKCGAPRAPAPETATQWGGLDLKSSTPALRAAPGAARDLGTAATMVSRAAAPAASAAPAFSLPPLVAPEPPPASVAGRGRALGGDDELVVLGNSAALDLDVGGSTAQAPAAGIGGGSLELAAPVARKARSRNEDSVEVQEERVGKMHALADFGAVGSGALEAAQYALRVLVRRRALRKELSELCVQRDTAQRAAQTAHAALGEAIFARRSETALQPVVRELRAVAEAMVALDDTRNASADAMAQAQAKVDAASAQMAELETQLAPVREREKGVLAAINRIEQHKARLQAMDKRAQIELRALAQAQKADPARVAALQAEQGGHAGELASLSVKLQPFSDDLGEVRRELAKHAGTLAALQDDRKAALRALGELKKQLNATAGSAETLQQDTLCGLARTVLERGLGVLEPQQAARATAAGNDFAARQAAVKLHEDALQSQDDASFKRGCRVLGGAALALLAALVTLMVR